VTTTMIWPLETQSLKEEWSGRDQGESFRIITVHATVNAPIQLDAMTAALRKATGNPNAVHPRDWP
jgi:hypothetical protein